MSREFPSTETFEALSPSRKARVETFITDKIRFGDLEVAVDHAARFERKDMPLARTVVLIPVAAHQESGRIGIALAEYAKQVTDQPFSVLLFLNCPDELADSERIQASLDEYLQAIVDYPDLDVRFSLESYPEPTIGQIRRDLWNSAILLAHHEGLFDDNGDVIGINHDIDIDSIDPSYIQRIQAYYANNTPLQLNGPARPRSTLLRHSFPTEQPNIGKVVAWTDLAYYQRRQQGGYEASLVMPFSWYVLGDGFDKTAKTYETNGLLRGNLAPAIPGTVLHTSPRRYVERLGDFGIVGIWTDESFTANDECRERTDFPDISEQKAEEIIFETLADTIETLFIKPIFKRNDLSFMAMALLHEAGYELTDEVFDNIVDMYKARVQQKLRLAEYALRHMVGSDMLADLITSSYDTDKISREFAKIECEKTIALGKFWIDFQKNELPKKEVVLDTFEPDDVVVVVEKD